MFCYKCGKENDDDSEFCYNCGTKISEEKSEEVSKKKIPIKEEEIIVKKKSPLPVIIIILILCIAIAVVVLIAFVMPNSGASRQYKLKIEAAVEYFEDEDYERAILAYEEAIKIDPNNKDAYLGLADVYIAMGDNEKAIEVLVSIDAELDDKSQKAIDDKISEVEKMTGLNSDDVKKKKPSDKKAEKVELIVYAYNANASADGYNEAIEGADVSLIKGFDSDGEAVYKATTAGDGGAVIENVEPGEYTVIFEKDGFAKSKENVNIGDGAVVKNYMVQRPTEGDVAVKVTWEGDQDIDLCFFNATSKERISYGNPIDTYGSFIYSDNKDTHFEMVYLRDINNGDVRSLYVVDAGAAENNQSSSMESDGVKISVYEGDECIYEKQANTGKTENVWYSFYLYEGEVYDVDEYYNAGSDGYDWALLSKEGAKAEVSVFDVDNVAIKEYTKFLNGQATFKKDAYYKNGDYTIYDCIDEGKSFGGMRGPYTLAYRFIYVDGAEYPALLLEKLYSAPSEKYDLCTSDVILYKNGKLVLMHDGFEGFADEGGWVSYKNYIAFEGGYDQFGDDFETVYRMNSNYEFVADTPFLICFANPDPVYIDVTGWTDNDYKNYYASHYKGWITYKPDQRVSVAEHFESLRPLNIIATKPVKIN